jgi:hypothetical protein
MTALPEYPEVGLRQDSYSAGRRFDPYTAHQTSLACAGGYSGEAFFMVAAGYTPSLDLSV